MAPTLLGCRRAGHPACPFRLYLQVIYRRACSVGEPRAGSILLHVQRDLQQITISV
jgi:hypothetical protein